MASSRMEEVRTESVPRNYRIDVRRRGGIRLYGLMVGGRRKKKKKNNKSGKNLTRQCEVWGGLWGPDEEKQKVGGKQRQRRKHRYCASAAGGWYRYRQEEKTGERPPR